MPSTKVKITLSSTNGNSNYAYQAMYGSSEGAGNVDLGSMQGRRADDYGAVLVVPLAEAAGDAAQALAVDLDLRAHPVERLDVAEAFLVHSLVDD